MRPFPVAFLAMVVIAATSAYAGRPAPVKPLRISGDLAASSQFLPGDLDKLPQASAETTDEDGSTIKWTGVLLRTLLEKAGAPAGKALRGKGLASYILAKARDGYEVVFTPAELDPAFGNENVLVVYKRNGKPLFDYEGPYRILCPSDKAGARSLRMLESLEIVKLRK